MHFIQKSQNVGENILILNKPFCICKICSDSIQVIYYVLIKYGLVLSTLLCIVRRNVAVMWLMVTISINFHRHICYITTMVTYNPALTTILPILLLYLNTVIVTAGTFEP
jgi:hypothetical protein